MKQNNIRYFIKTFGCQANIADSNKIASILESMGMKNAKSSNGADVLVINTCSVRQKSEDKVYGLGRLLKNKDKPFVMMTGCMVGSSMGDRKRYDLSDLKRKTPWVDLYLKDSDIGNLQNILLSEGFNFDQDYFQKSLLMNYYQKVYEDHAIVNISYGCDNFCSYCVVPYSRGEEVSRSRDEIFEEVGGFIKNGHKKIMLCGQNVNSWGLSKEEKLKIRIGSSQKLPFADLLREVHDLEGIEEISFLSSNPFDFTEDLINAIKLPKISNYIHIAVQSGNNDVLRRMNRRHTSEEFIDLIKRIRIAKPGLELGTDIIVGFPGETKDHFMDTVKLFQTVKFNVAFISIYSERIGTLAQKNYEDDISLIEKKRRHKFLTKVWRDSLHE